MCRAQFRSSDLINRNIMRQKGFSLPIVMIMMLVLAVMVLAATQAFNTESRISSNDADKKMAMQVAEDVLKFAETEIVTQDLLNEGKFPAQSGCDYQGLCRVDDSTNNIAIWEQECGKGKPCLGYDTRTNNRDNAGKVFPVGSELPVAQNPLYLIEWMGGDDKKLTFRVTARAWGQNKNTVVTVQSYVVADL